MTNASEYRIRIFEPVCLAATPPTAEPELAAQAALAGDPSKLATVETDGGDGPVLVVVLGNGGSHRTEYYDDELDRTRLVVRTWQVVDAYEDATGIAAANFLAAEYRDALAEEGVQGVRLITAEWNDEDGAPTIEGISWYDSADDPYGDEEE